MRYILTFLVALVLCTSCTTSKHNVVSRHAMVPDKETAIRIAEAVLIPIYGEKIINGQRPLVATRSFGTWTVRGTLPAHYDVGGVAEIDIRKSDGTILRVTHGK